MAIWTNATTVLTDAGKTLLSHAQAGNGGITIVKAVPGAGRVADNLLHLQTAITNPKPDMLITGKSANPAGTILNTQLNNRGLEASYDLTQIGIYASNPNTGTVLYLIAQCTAGTEDTIPLPTVTPVVLNFSFYILHGTEATVDITVSNAGFVSAVDFYAHRHPNATILLDGFMSKEDKVAHNLVVGRVNQDLKTTSSPTFAGLTVNGNISGATFL